MRRTLAASVMGLSVALLAGCGLLPNSASSDVVLRGTVLGLGQGVRASSDVPTTMISCRRSNGNGVARSRAGWPPSPGTPERSTRSGPVLASWDC